MDAKLPDPRPLIHVCDRHDFIEEMTGYLYKSSLQKYIEVFLYSRQSCWMYEFQSFYDGPECVTVLRCVCVFVLLCICSRRMFWNLKATQVEHSFLPQLCDTVQAQRHVSHFVPPSLSLSLKVYVQKVSPHKTPMVVGKLLDLDCSEDFIRQLLNSVGHQCPVDELVEQVSTTWGFFQSLSRYRRI